MSIWTHVVGAFRVDTTHPDENLLMELLGHEATFEEMWEMAKKGKSEAAHKLYEDCPLPKGSEGSLQYHVHVYRPQGGMPWVVVAVWGDLRDYDSVEEIKKWWCETLRTVGDAFAGIRDAVLRIEVEGEEAVVVQWDEPEA